MRKIFLIILISIPFNLFAQWEVNSGFYFKDDLPYTGFGVQFGRNLPLQAPDLGAKVRFDADYFTTTVRQNQITSDLVNSNYSLFILISFYERYFYPYLGLGFGIGNFNFNNENIISFQLSTMAGLEIFFSENISPFIEAQVLKYFADLNEFIPAENSEITFRGVIGIKFKFNVID